MIQLIILNKILVWTLSFSHKYFDKFQNKTAPITYPSLWLGIKKLI